MGNQMTPGNSSVTIRNIPAPQKHNPPYSLTKQHTNLVTLPVTPLGNNATPVTPQKPPSPLTVTLLRNTRNKGGNTGVFYNTRVLPRYQTVTNHG